MKKAASTAATSSSPTNMTFEVFGKVQGVFFRKYTKKKATKLNIKGWVENTASGTVVGAAEAPDAAALAQFSAWLRTTGSKKSRIDRAEFQPYAEPKRFAEFSIRR
jgi:acylphosphatase